MSGSNQIRPNIPQNILDCFFCCLAHLEIHLNLCFAYLSLKRNLDGVVAGFFLLSCGALEHGL